MANSPKPYRPYVKREKSFRPASKQAKTADRGYGAKWREASAAYLRVYRLCAECLRAEPTRYTNAQCVDHIQPHKGDHGLMWDTGNWQPLCLSCHGRKTRKEQRGQ